MRATYVGVGLQGYIVPQYDTYPDTVVMIHNTLHNNKTRRVLPRVLLVGSVCTADIGSTHAFVYTILNIMLNTAQHGFFLVSLFGKSPCISGRMLSTN